jgi:hypothetical protein
MRKRKLAKCLIWFAAIVSLEGCPIIVGRQPGATTDYCAKIPEPAPFEPHVDMEIDHGETIRCDAGCEKLVKEYAAQIEAHRAACGKP